MLRTTRGFSQLAWWKAERLETATARQFLERQRQIVGLWLHRCQTGTVPDQPRSGRRPSNDPAAGWLHHWLHHCHTDTYGTYFSYKQSLLDILIVQELCDSRGGRPGLSVLTSLLGSVDLKIY